jgi:MFS family permease
VAAAGLANFGARLVLGSISDRFGPVRVLQVCQIGMATTAAFWMSCTSEATLMSLMLFYGLFGSAFFSMVPIITAVFFGPMRASGNIALIFFGAVPGVSCAAMIAGLLYDATGDYTAACIMTVAMLGSSAMVLTTLPQKPPPLQPPLRGAVEHQAQQAKIMSTAGVTPVAAPVAEC